VNVLAMFGFFRSHSSPQNDGKVGVRRGATLFLLLYLTQKGKRQMQLGSYLIPFLLYRTQKGKRQTKIGSYLF